MNKVDQYILILFVRVFFICMTCLTGLVVVVDLFTNLDDFIGAAKDRKLSEVLLGYYGPFTLSLYSRLCPFFALLALLFTVSWLKRTNELTALMAAGITKGRVLKYPLIATVILLVTAAVLRETLIPKYQDVLGKRPQDLTGENLRTIRPALDPQTGILIGGHNIELLHEQIIHPVFRLPSSVARVGRQVSAENANYIAATPEHGAGYLLSNVSAPVGLTNIPSISINDHPVILTPVDNNWLEPHQCFIVSSVQFFLLQGGSSWGQYDSTLNIVRRLHAQPAFYGADVRVKVHARFVQPILDMTLILFSLPIVLARFEHKLFWMASKTTWAIIFFTGVVLGTQTIAASNSLISPFLGAWLPLLCMLPYAYAKTRVAMLS